MRKTQIIHSSWQFKLLKENVPGLIPKSIRKELNSWKPAQVPGTVHTDLFRAGLIPDPFYAENEKILGWIPEADWIYRTTFSLSDEMDKNREILLELKGIDTYAEIRLNNKLLGVTSDMFIEYIYPVEDILKKSNTLEIRFLSPEKTGRSLEKKYGKLPVALASERVYLRKAQYSFGWDWGPSFPTSGIWKSISLVQYPDVYIKNVLFNTISADEKKALVEVNVDLNRNLKSGYKVRADLAGESEFLKINKKTGSVRLTVPDPALWWPNGSGSPNLYKLTLNVINSRMEVVDKIEKEVGIRTIKLQLTDNKRSSFRFIVNDVPVFARGANWIPADSFLSDISEYKYQKLVNFARIANMNMLRVWGGGVYENDIFYNLCDRMGILVWQDFMFACGAYPVHKDFLNDVEEEVRQNVLRLQYHPSIAIWCGNNENEWIWYQEQKDSYKNIPGYRIWHKLIPSVLSELDPARPYWPSSPFIDEKNTTTDDPNSSLSGNRHQWDLWSRWLDYNNVKDDTSLFVTEFGFQGPANPGTWTKALPSDSLRINDKIFEFHNKQVEGPERVLKFLGSHLPLVSRWEDFIYMAQLSQALALKACIEHWYGRYPETSGCIIWQLNDCWPVTSWSLIDSEVTPKISWYFVKRFFSPRSVLINRHNDSVKIHNHSREYFNGVLRIHLVNSESGSVLHEEIYPIEVRGLSDVTIKQKSGHKFNNLPDTIILATLYNERDQKILRTFRLNTEWKHLLLPDPDLKILRRTEEENTVFSVTSDTSAFFVDIYHPSFIMSDRGFILLPGEQVNILTVSRDTEINTDELKIFSLNNYLSR